MEALLRMALVACAAVLPPGAPATGVDFDGDEGPPILAQGAAARPLASVGPLATTLLEYQVGPEASQIFSAFGYAVALSDPYAVFGAPRAGAPPATRSTGAAYICSRSEGGWSAGVALPRSGAASNDWFGCAVAISQPFVAVGASGQGTETARGAVYVYENVGGAWIARAQVTAVDGVKGDRFGQAVALDGDVLLVGACDADNGTNSGAAYVFRRSGTSWVQERKLIPSDSAPRQGFGNSVSVVGDLAVVGAPTDDAKGIGAGAVYVFARTAGAWAEEAKIVAGDGNAGDQFGWAVSLASNRLAVGAYGSDAKASDAGAVYVFVRDGVNWVQQGKVTGSDGGAGDRLGYAVSLCGDRVLAGAYRHAFYEMTSGAAYLYTWDGTNWLEDAKITASNGALGTDLVWGAYIPGHYGQSVALFTNRLVIGARLADQNGVGAFGRLYGTAFLYDIQ